MPRPIRLQIWVAARARLVVSSGAMAVPWWGSTSVQRWPDSRSGVWMLLLSPTFANFHLLEHRLAESWPSTHSSIFHERSWRGRSPRSIGCSGQRVDCCSQPCLLYTSDAADEEDSVDLGGRRIIKKKK